MTANKDEQIVAVVRRTDLRTGLYRMLSLPEAVEQLGRKLSARDFPSRLEILARLCSGERVETDTHAYLWE